MNQLFQKHEIQFIVWTSLIFLASVTLLVVFGLVPTEFKVNGGETFEQRTRNAVREIIEGKSTTEIKGTTSNTQNGNTATNVTNTNNPANYPVNYPSNYPNSGGSNYTTGTAGGNEAVNNNNPGSTNSNITVKAEAPVRLVIPSIGVDTKVLNPKSTSSEVLDTELTKGAVRYPGSGLLGAGNMFIFGHSTGFGVVQNAAYKVFNKLKNVKTGDLITVYGAEATYQYRVTSMKLVDKENALVTFNTKKNMLTLSTCDSFGRAEDRYVVEAEFVSAKAI